MSSVFLVAVYKINGRQDLNFCENKKKAKSYEFLVSSFFFLLPILISWDNFKRGNSTSGKEREKQNRGYFFPSILCGSYCTGEEGKRHKRRHFFVACPWVIVVVAPLYLLIGPHSTEYWRVAPYVWLPVLTSIFYCLKGNWACWTLELRTHILVRQLHYWILDGERLCNRSHKNRKLFHAKLMLFDIMKFEIEIRISIKLLSGIKSKKSKLFWGPKKVLDIIL